LQGIDGSVLRREAGSQRFVLSREVTLPTHQATQTLKLAELGWLYTQVDKVTLPTHQATQTLKLAELGWLYTQVDKVTLPFTGYFFDEWHSEICCIPC
jgi:hypothetical protein